MRRILSGLLLTLLFVSILTFRSSLVVVKSSNDYPVHNLDTNLNYTTIQGAIDAEETVNGHIIFVKVGTYYENVVVDKSLTLVGENVRTTIVDGNGTGTVFNITQSKVNITGFTIQNSSRHRRASGILLTNVLNCSVSENHITNNYNGIRLSYSSNINIFGNNITENQWALYFIDCNNTCVYDNIALNNTWDGFSLWSCSYNNFTGNNAYLGRGGFLLDGCYNNTFTRNKASNNGFGISIRDSSNNTFTDNNVSDNQFGIIIDSTGYGPVSSGNTLTGNTALNNSYGFGVTVDPDVTPSFDNHIDTSNMVDDKPIYYLVNESDIVIDSETNACTVYLINCNNVTVKHLNLTKNLAGVFLFNTTNSMIKNVTVSSNSHAGIWLLSSNNNTLVSNTATNNTIGIYLQTMSNNNTLSLNNASSNLGMGIGTIPILPSGIALELGLSNTLNHNTISKNWHGIQLIWATNNSIFCNNFTENFHGLLLDNSHINSVFNNYINNNDDGIVLQGSIANSIFHNSFLNNTDTIYSISSYNIWDNDYPSGGNYWDDYTGNDFHSGPHQNETSSDGLGDSPYITAADNIDQYPLMQPYYGPVRNLDTGQSYSEIQKAINNATENDRMLILSGTYFENVVVNKSLSLTGESRETTIIDGNGSGTVVHVTSNDVSISCFTVRNSGSGWHNGIELSGSNNYTITDNILTNNSWGIKVSGYSRDIIINHNLITDNGQGLVFFYGGDGVNVVIKDNNITRNRSSGIYLWSDGKIIKNNNITGNIYGIEISQSFNNTIFHNNFNNNSEQVYNDGTSVNIWNDGCEGNYWSDYNGTDSDGDGVGDTPYVIDAENIDNYPLMNVYWNPCDINHDLTVDMKDVGTSARAFYSELGDPDYNCHADITGPIPLEPDGIVNMRDIGLIARNFGETYT